MDSRHSMHSSRGGGGPGGMPGMGIPPGGPGNGPPHHHLSHQPPHHHGPPPSGPHYDDRDRMSAPSGPVGRIHRPSPPSSDPYYGHHHQQAPPHQPHHQHHQQQLQHHQHSHTPHHAQHPHQAPPHHAPHPSHGIQQSTRQYKEHSRSPESERMPQSYRPPQSQQRNDSLTPLSLTTRSPAGPPPPMYSMPRASTPDQQHTSSRAPSLTGSPSVYRGPHHPPHPPPPPPASHSSHHPHPPHHQIGPESMMNPPPPHHRSMPPPSSPHHTSTPIQQQPPQQQHQGQQHQSQQHQGQQQHPQQGRQPPPPPSHGNQSAPYSGGRDLPSLNNAPPPPPPPRQTTGMSISAMLDGPAHPTSTAPPKPTSSQPPSDYNSNKRSYTPDYPHQNVDRSRNASIASSPGIMSNQHQGYGPSGGKGRATPDHGYRPHMPHGPPGIMPNHPHGVPPRPVSQPLASTTPHSLSSVLHQHQDEGPHRGHARSASYHDRETNVRDRERERDMRERQEMVQRERYEHEMREKEKYEREMREREMREREIRERQRELRERELRYEREVQEREMAEREREREKEIKMQREREMREMREREQREREMREREQARIQEMREREMREMQERERRERETREREHRERGEMLERERERDRERDKRERERERIANAHMGPSSPHANHHPHQHGPPAYHSHPLTSNSNPHPSMTSAAPVPHGPSHTTMVSGIATLPPQQPLNSSHGPPPPPQTSSSYQSFGYTTAMPPSPFALQPALSLPPPPPGEGHDRRRQGYVDNQHGRAEELFKQMNERKAAAQSVAQAQIDRKNPLLTMSGYDINRMEEGMSGQPVPKRGTMEKEEKEEIIVGSRGKKEKVEKEREAEEEGPTSSISMNTGKKRRHVHHVHHHHPHPHPHPHPHHHHIHLHHAHDNDERYSLDGGPLHPQAQSIAQASNKRAMTPVPHHHHPPRHHSPAPQPPAKRPKLTINSKPVVASVANLPRYHLGSMVYNPHGNSNASSKGYSTTHSMLPRFEGRENCIFQIRIPRRYLYERERAEICKRRWLWGSEVYTDDSDVLAVLIHVGKIPPVLPDGVEPEMILPAQPGLMDDKDKELGRKGNRAAGKGKAALNGPSSNAIPAMASTDKINGAPSASANSTSNGYLNINKDIIVDILILPPLEKYSSTVCNAMKSRSWAKQHDGMSYMVHEVKTAEPGEAEGRGKSMRKQRLNEREHIRKWGTLPGREGEGGLRTLVGREAKVGA